MAEELENSDQLSADGSTLGRLTAFGELPERASSHSFAPDDEKNIVAVHVGSMDVENNFVLWTEHELSETLGIPVKTLQRWAGTDAPTKPTLFGGAELLLATVPDPADETTWYVLCHGHVEGGGYSWRQAIREYRRVGAVPGDRGHTIHEYVLVRREDERERWAQVLGDPETGVVVELGGGHFEAAQAAVNGGTAAARLMPEPYRDWRPSPVPGDQFWGLRNWP